MSFFKFKPSRLLFYLLSIGLVFAGSNPVLSQLPQAEADTQTLPIPAPPGDGSANPSSSPPNSPVPQTIIPNTTAVVKRQPARICFFDSGTQPLDGDAIAVGLNGKVVARKVVLSLVPKCFNFRLRPGVNRATVTALNAGKVPFNTPGVAIPNPTFFDGLRLFGGSLLPGQTAVFTLAFPQVEIFRSETPKSAEHAADAQRRGFSRLGTIDRDGAEARGRQSLRNSGLPTKPGFDRDEYPPKVFLENGGRASVCYVPSADNQLAGSLLGGQTRVFENGDTVELVVTPAAGARSCKRS